MSEQESTASGTVNAFDADSRMIARCKYILEQVTLEHEKLFAIALSIESGLRPADEKNPSEDDPVTQWRLAQVLIDRLGSDFICGLKWAVEPEVQTSARPSLRVGGKG